MADPVHPVMLPEERETILGCLAKGKSLTAACKAARVSYGHVRRLRRRDPEFDRLYRMACESQDDRVEDRLYKSARKGHYGAQVLWLTNRAPDRWQRGGQKPRPTEKAAEADAELTVKDVIQHFAEKKNANGPDTSGDAGAAGV